MVISPQSLLRWAQPKSGAGKPNMHRDSASPLHTHRGPTRRNPGRIALAISLILLGFLLRPLFEPAAAADRHAPQAHPANVVGDLQREVQAIATRRLATGMAQVAVVYQNLSTGEEFQLGDKLLFNPASMLKLPAAVAWLRYVERQPQAQAQLLRFTMTAVRESYTDPHALQVGQSYMPTDMLERMIRWSRNDAKALLVSALPPHALAETYELLGLNPEQAVMQDDPAVTVGQMAGLFTALQAGRVLEPKDTSYLLDMLAQTDFEYGLRAGLPPQTRLAHKWGRRVHLDGPKNERVQLHDCGIVERSGAPFLLCVMTRGDSDSECRATIAEIAAAAWNWPAL